MNKKNGERLICIITIILFLALLYFCANSEMITILKNQNPIDLNEVIQENRNINIIEEMIYEEQDLEYNTQYINNESLPSGTIHVSQIGVTGIQDVITIKNLMEMN